MSKLGFFRRVFVGCKHKSYIPPTKTSVESHTSVGSMLASALFGQGWVQPNTTYSTVGDTTCNTCGTNIKVCKTTEGWKVNSYPIPASYIKYRNGGMTLGVAAFLGYSLFLGTKHAIYLPAKKLLKKE